MAGGLNLTKVRHRINNIKRKLYYGTDVSSLKFLNVNDVLLELPEGWHMPIRPTSGLVDGAEYWELSIADLDDEINLDELIPLTTQVEVNGERYTISPYRRPRGVTRSFKLRLQSTGERG